MGEFNAGERYRRQIMKAAVRDYYYQRSLTLSPTYKTKRSPIKQANKHTVLSIGMIVNNGIKCA
jgi:hypothetical protein